MSTLQRWVSLSLILISSTALLSCGGAEERKVKYLERGKAYLAEKNYDKATIELKNALQIDPKYSEGYFLLGQIAEEKADYGKAFSNYNQAVELNPDHYQAREKIARFYIMGGQPAKAEEMVDYILKKKPDDVGAKSIYSVLLANKGKDDEALSIALAVIKADPTKTEAAQIASSIYRKKGDKKKAEEIIEQSLAANPKDIALRDMVVRDYLQDKDIKRAEGMLQEIVKLEPDQIQHRTALASFYSQTKQFDKAEKVLRDAIKADPKDTNRYILLASFLVSQNRSAQAESEIRAAIESFPQNFDLRFVLAAHYVETGKPDQAEAIYRKVMEINKVGPSSMTARTRLADLLRSENKSDEAFSLISEVLKDNPSDSEALLIRGKLELGKDKLDLKGAITDFRSILKSQPDNVDVLTLLAVAHQQIHEPALARESLQKAVKAAPKNADASARLADFMVRNDKDIDGALKVLNDFLSATPDNLTVLQMKLNILGAKKDTNGIVETLAYMKKAFPDKSIGYYSSGEYYLAQGKYQEAIHEFEQARDRSKNDFQAVGAISNVYLKIGKPVAALKEINDYLKVSPKSLEAFQMKATVLASMKDTAGFLRLVEEIKRLYPDKAYGYSLAGEFYLRQNNFDNALREYKAAAEKNPDDGRIMKSVVMAYLGQRKPDDAFAWLTQISKNKPDDGNVSYLMGEVLLSQKKYEQSVAQFQKALHKMPNVEEIYIVLSEANVQQNHLDDAISVLKKGIEVNPDSDKLLLRLASLYEISGQFDNSIQTYDQLLKKNPGNVPAANNLASILADQKGDKASLERARQLAAPFETSGQPALLDTLGWVYYKLDDIDKALPLLKKAVDTAPKSGVLRYHLGMAYYKQGDKAAAKSELTSAFATGEKFAGEDEGRATLKSLQ